ncbi:integral membrane protein [Histoplasma ohiense]|nr:integral membrane protein [Histoplasma ohiense (nom. inval.)]
MAPKSLIPFLVAMMLVTGVCNTILTKYQDMQCVRNCDSPDPKKRVVFEQPVVQTLQMFIGEMGCWLVVLACKFWNRYISHRLGGSSEASLLTGGYEPVDGADNDLAESDDELDSTSPLNGSLRASTTKRSKEHDGRIKLKGWKVFMLAAPACCDITGTTLMNVGLLFVVASIYQMTRGALVLFVGLFSVLFLRRKLYLYQWLALVVAVLGVGIVGLAGAIFKDNTEALGDSRTVAQLISRAEELDGLSGETPVAVRTIIGVLLIAGAQIFTATQFVLEEWILENYAMDPLQVVGWEGIFGFLVTLFGMIILHFAIGNTENGRHGYFDMREGWHNTTTNKAVAISGILIMISIGGFNFFGLSVTRSVSATSRSTIDTCRTLFIWMISLGLGWESFKWLQVVGFAMLVYGTFLFNDIVNPPLKACVPTHRPREELFPEEPIEHI